MKKNRILIIILSLSLLLVSCKKNDASKELPKEDNLVLEDTNEEKKYILIG